METGIGQSPEEKQKIQLSLETLKINFELQLQLLKISIHIAWRD